MSGQIFAFKVSKEIESIDEKAMEQWVGNQVTIACMHCLCTGGQSYGLSACYTDPEYICDTSNDPGYYLCDSI